MKKINPLKIHIRSSDSFGLFHNSRADVALLAKSINALIEKQNEIISKVNELIDERKAPE